MKFFTFFERHASDCKSTGGLSDPSHHDFGSVGFYVTQTGDFLAILGAKTVRASKEGSLPLWAQNAYLLRSCFFSARAKPWAPSPSTPVTMPRGWSSSTRPPAWMDETSHGKVLLPLGQRQKTAQKPHAGGRSRRHHQPRIFKI